MANQACCGRLNVDVEVKANALRDFILLTLWPSLMTTKALKFSKLMGLLLVLFHRLHTGTVLPFNRLSFTVLRLLKYRLREKIEVVDLPNKTFSYNITEGDLLKYYKSFKAHSAMFPKEDGGLVKWSYEFEKASEVVPDPSLIKEFATKNLKELDDYLGKQA